MRAAGAGEYAEEVAGVGSLVDCADFSPFPGFLRGYRERHASKIKAGQYREEKHWESEYAGGPQGGAEAFAGRPPRGVCLALEQAGRDAGAGDAGEKSSFGNRWKGA